MSDPSTKSGKTAQARAAAGTRSVHSALSADLQAALAERYPGVPTGRALVLAAAAGLGVPRGRAVPSLPRGRRPADLPEPLAIEGIVAADLSLVGIGVSGERKRHRLRVDLSAHTEEEAERISAVLVAEGWRRPRPHIVETDRPALALRLWPHMTAAVRRTLLSAARAAAPRRRGLRQAA